MSVLVVFNHYWELPLQLLVEGDLGLAHSMFGALLLPHAPFRHKNTHEAGVWLAGGSLPQVFAGWGFIFEEAPF